MDIVHVYKQKDLDEVNVFGVISHNIYIHGGDAVSLDNIRLIKGYLGFSDVPSIDLCDIEEICGDLWISTFYSVPNSVTLSKLKRIGGSANLNFTPIKNLGTLEYVGLDLCLRDTEIKDLGSVTHIGGKLVLPYDLKNKVDLSNIEIGGEVKFFRISKNKSKLTKSDLGLSLSEIPVPEINRRTNETLVPKYIACISEANQEQKKFFNYFKECFFNGKIIDVGCFYEYPKFLLEEMVSDEGKDISVWIHDYERLTKAYPNIIAYGAYMLRWRCKRYDLGWEVENRQPILNISNIGYYEEKLSRQLFDTEHLLRFSGATCLSNWGSQHINEIKPFIEQQLEDFQNKWGHRFLNIFVDPTLNTGKDYDFYRQFYATENIFNLYNSQEYGKYIPTNYEKPLPNIVENAIKSQCRKFTMDAEDAYRVSIGMPKIGEYWRSETELYYSIKEAFKNTEVKQHASPNWLGLQHLDIYLPAYNIGIEYQGIQHYKPVEYFGGEEAFIKGQERDARKKRLCRENDCVLIYVNEGYNLNEVINCIHQHINIMTTKHSN